MTMHEQPGGGPGAPAAPAGPAQVPAKAAGRRAGGRAGGCRRAAGRAAGPAPGGRRRRRPGRRRRPAKPPADGPGLPARELRLLTVLVACLSRSAELGRLTAGPARRRGPLGVAGGRSSGRGGRTASPPSRRRRRSRACIRAASSAGRHPVVAGALRGAARRRRRQLRRAGPARARHGPPAGPRWWAGARHPRRGARDGAWRRFRPDWTSAAARRLLLTGTLATWLAVDALLGYLAWAPATRADRAAALTGNLGELQLATAPRGSPRSPAGARRPAGCSCGLVLVAARCGACARPSAAGADVGRPRSAGCGGSPAPGTSTGSRGVSSSDRRARPGAGRRDPRPVPGRRARLGRSRRLRGAARGLGRGRADRARRRWCSCSAACGRRVPSAGTGRTRPTCR